jgi:hypothetical protein
MKIMKCLLAAVLPLSVVCQNIGIGTTTPVPSAILELRANNRGVLIPRLTTLQINGISSPANGLLVYNTDSAAFTYRANSAWVYVRGTATPGNIAWSITGNDGTNAATHFIGTTNDMDIVFRRGGERAGIINLDSMNTSWGLGALSAGTIGRENTAIGFNALNANTSGYENTATGLKALFRNTEGVHNTAYGSGSLLLNTTGSTNTALSTYALFNNVTGNRNTAVGYAALQANQAGSNHTALGSFALTKAKGTNNTAVGFSAGADNISGSFNLFLGNEAGRSETGSNKLYISNSNTNKNNTLVYGEFDNKLLAIDGKVGIGMLPDSSFPVQIKGQSAKSNIMMLFNEAGAPKWDVTLEGDNLNFYKHGVADRMLLLGGNGEVRIGQNSSNQVRQGRLTVKQRGQDDGISLEHPTNSNRWNLWHSAVSNGLLLGYNDRFSGIFAPEDGSYSILSDRRLKKDITAYQPVLDKLIQIKPYHYHYIHGESNAPFSSGFMAQDIQKIFPDAVSALEYKNGEAMLGINYQYFTVAAIKGIQEQQQKINEQEQKINEQEVRIQKLEVALQKLLQSKE